MKSKASTIEKTIDNPGNSNIYAKRTIEKEQRQTIDNKRKPIEKTMKIKQQLEHTRKNIKETPYTKP